MSTILGVKFREAGQVYYFSSGAFVVNTDDTVIVSTDQGYGLGKVVVVRDDLPEDAEVEELKPIFRLAVEEDFEKHKENEELAREAFDYCRKRIRERKLDMKLVDVDVFFDRSKIIFYFTAPSRIDFRDLVKDLVRTYRTRIELRQIGVRHETQMVGAVGNCGQVCCCRRFLRKFAPVTIRMAKEQNLFLNPAKISGMCGRLLCCLSYEQSNYEEFHRSCPKIGKKYVTRDGSLKVLRANIFRNSLNVIMDGGGEREYTLEEWEDLSAKRPDQAQQQGQQEAPQRKSKPRSRPAEAESRESSGRKDEEQPAAPEKDEEKAPAPGGIFGLGPEVKENARQSESSILEESGQEEPGQNESGQNESGQNESGKDASGKQQDRQKGTPDERQQKSKRKRSSRSRRGGRSKGQGERTAEQKAREPKPQDGKPKSQKGSAPSEGDKPKGESGDKPGGDGKGKPRRKRRRKPRSKSKPNNQQ